MTTEALFRIAFLILFLALLAMRVYFMIQVRKSGGQIMPDEGAIQREGGRGVFVLRVIAFLALMTFLVMYFLRAKWIDAFLFPLPGWLRWLGFILGMAAVLFWTWTQVALDRQWSPQLQLTKGHQLITVGPYARIRHPLYSAMFGWGIALALLTANWIFVGIGALMVIGLLWRVPKEEQMMLEAFGDEYKIYMGRTGRFLPRLGITQIEKGTSHV